MKRNLLFIVMALVAFTWSCQKDEIADKFQNPIDNLKTAEAVCVPQVFPLFAGQTNNIGTVTVFNDKVNLYVTYQSEQEMEEFALYILDYEPQERLTPGQAPFKNNGPAKNFTFTIPLADLSFDVDCGTTLWLQAKTVSSGETAYGGVITPAGSGSWYGNIEYVICCEPNGGAPKCYEFNGETAWAANGNVAGEMRYNRRGNWATYVQYTAKTTTLFAGQNIPVGTVNFSEVVDGEVTITIALTGNWIFAEYEMGVAVEDNIKIQDYVSAPSGNPAPGQFAHKATAEGQSFNITVPANNFYGVHVDVGYWFEVECPEEE